MKVLSIRNIGLTLLCLFVINGCSTGNTYIAFGTQSTVGINLDSRPPTFDLGLARREQVIAPTFEGGQTPTTMASFRSAYKGITGLFVNVGSTFTGGDAAGNMSWFYGEEGNAPFDKSVDTSLCLTQEAQSKIFGESYSLPKPGDARPFFMATETILGFKLSWSGLLGQLPDALKLGYNRKEFSWAPVFISADDCLIGHVKGKKANVPSFLGLIDVSNAVGTTKQVAGEHIQYIATGTSATRLALKEEIRKVMLRRLNPELVESVGDSSITPSSNLPIKE